MIRINLLPVKRKKKTQPLPQYVVYAIAIFVATIAAIVIFTVTLNSSISERKNKVAVNQARLKELEEQLKEVANFEKDNEAYQRKNEVIRQLKRNQNAPLRMLDELSGRLPDGVWLTELNDKSGLVDIAGYAFSNTDIVSYVQGLKDSKYMTDVALLESRQEKVGDSMLYQFKLRLRMKV